MSIAVSVLTTSRVARNSGGAARQERNPQSATAYSSVRYSQAYLRNHWVTEFIYELDFYKDSVPLNLVTQLP